MGLINPLKKEDVVDTADAMIDHAADRVDQAVTHLTGELAPAAEAARAALTEDVAKGIQETEQAGEQLAAHVEAAAPGTFAAILRSCLDVLAEYEFSFGSIGLRKRKEQ